MRGWPEVFCPDSTSRVSERRGARAWQLGVVLWDGSEAGVAGSWVTMLSVSAKASLCGLPAGLLKGDTGRPEVWVWAEQSERNQTIASASLQPTWGQAPCQVPHNHSPAVYLGHWRIRIHPFVQEKIFAEEERREERMGEERRG